MRAVVVLGAVILGGLLFLYVAMRPGQDLAAVVLAAIAGAAWGLASGLLMFAPAKRGR